MALLKANSSSLTLAVTSLVDADVSRPSRGTLRWLSLVHCLRVLAAPFAESCFFLFGFCGGFFDEKSFDEADFVSFVQNVFFSFFGLLTLAV